MNDLADRVNAASSELDRSGKKVTAEAVRAALGGGSMRDLAPALRIWKASRAAAKLASSASPESVKRIGEAAITSIWQEAERQASETLEAFKAKAKEETDSQEQDYNELSDRYDESQTQISSLKTSLEDLRLEAGRLRERLELTESKLHDSGASEAVLRATLESVQPLHEQLLSAAHAERNRALALVDALQKHLDEERSRCVTLQAKLDKRNKL